MNQIQSRLLRQWTAMLVVVGGGIDRQRWACCSKGLEMKIKDNAIALLPCSTCGRRDRISTTLNNYLKIWVTICHGCYLKYRQVPRQPQGYAGLGETEALSIADWNHLSEQVSNGQKPCRTVQEAAQVLGIELDESAAQERLDFETGKRSSDE